MTTSSETSIGPGSSLDLSPEILKLRDSYLEALQKMPKEEQDKLIRQQLEKEDNESNRIALLACRTLLLREKTVVLRAEIDEDQPSAMLETFRKKALSKKQEEKPKTVVSEEVDKQKEEQTPDQDEQKDEVKKDILKLRMLKPGDVNGVKFPSGIVIEVSKVDGERLLSDGSAELVEEDKTSKPEEDSQVKGDNEEETKDAVAKDEEDKKEGTKDAVAKDEEDKEEEAVGEVSGEKTATEDEAVDGETEKKSK